MATGPAIFLGWTALELNYSVFNKEKRNKEIEEEKKQNERMEEMKDKDNEDGHEKNFFKSPLEKREDYKR